MRSLAIVFGLLTGTPAMAFMTTTDKPDPFAHKHYSAKAIPKKAKPKSKVYSDVEIEAEIAAEHAGRPTPAQKAALKPAAAEPQLAEIERPSRKSDVQSAPSAAPTVYEANEPAPAPASSAFPKIVVCKFSVQPAKQRYGKGLISSRYLISDSDGFEACNDYGGEIVAGNDEDRGLLNVKDSALLRHSKK